jgi:hypothetical protein
LAAERVLASIDDGTVSANIGHPLSRKIVLTRLIYQKAMPTTFA